MAAMLGQVLEATELVRATLAAEAMKEALKELPVQEVLMTCAPYQRGVVLAASPNEIIIKGNDGRRYHVAPDRIQKVQEMTPQKARFKEWLRGEREVL